MSQRTTSDDQSSKPGVEGLLLLFALVAGVGSALQTRERALLSIGGDAAGYLAKSASAEQIPSPFVDRPADAIALWGVPSSDRSTRLINPVLRSGGAGRPAAGTGAKETTSANPPAFAAANPSSPGGIGGPLPEDGAGLIPGGATAADGAGPVQFASAGGLPSSGIPALFVPEAVAAAEPAAPVTPTVPTTPATPEVTVPVTPAPGTGTTTPGTTTPGTTTPETSTPAVTTPGTTTPETPPVTTPGTTTPEPSTPGTTTPGTTPPATTTPEPTTPGTTTPPPPVQSAIPEPMTWAMMVLGFGFIGGMIRRQRTKASAVSVAGS